MLQAIKRYTKLMMRRIKWGGDEFDEDEEEDDDDEGAMRPDGGDSKSTNRCDLVWIGTVVRRNFNAFRFQVMWQSHGPLVYESDIRSPSNAVARNANPQLQHARSWSRRGWGITGTWL